MKRKAYLHLLLDLDSFFSFLAGFKNISADLMRATERKSINKN
jgi:hypothetical protein